MSWADNRAYRASKRALDVVLSGAATVGLSPVMLGCAAAVKLTSPGPIIFKQARSGIHLQEFDMWKFRTMRTDTPELPSHLINAADWLTPVGGFLRKTSLDELPQLVNILRGDMSIVGPRPPLPTQADLIAQRAKYGANDVPVGLTGWAQINGRDELPIAQKAVFDGEYVRDASLLHDARIVLMTVAKVFRHEGVVESKVPEPDSTDNTESRISTQPSKTRRVLILANLDITITYFRMELVQALKKQGYEVHVACPYGTGVEELTRLGCIWHEARVNRHGTSPVDDCKLFVRSAGILKDVAPDMVLTYTVKPNVYGGIASKLRKTPFVANVTGLGTAIENGGLLQSITLCLYKAGLRGAEKVFFQNTYNRDFMLKNGVVKSAYEVLPGSGVNLDKYSLVDYPDKTSPISFLTIGRVMRDKGTDELLEAARTIKAKHPKVKFQLVGMFDGEYEGVISAAVAEGIVEYIPQQADIRPFVANSHALVHPSWHEGMSNVCLEAAAMGRPILASNIPGCKETFDESVSGFGFEPRSADSLVDILERFIAMSWEQQRNMGLAGRQKVEREFNRQIVVDKYLAEIDRVVES